MQKFLKQNVLYKNYFKNIYINGELTPWDAR